LILGIGNDITSSERWQRLIERHSAERAARKILHPDEAEKLLSGNRERLPERLAGRWALREAFGKALGLGLEGWHWRELRYEAPRLWAEGELIQELDVRGVRHLHASISHDAGLAMATVILEG
jgi:holo-[acyl-carrier protein] synthase